MNLRIAFVWKWAALLLLAFMPVASCLAQDETNTQPPAAIETQEVQAASFVDKWQGAVNLAFDKIVGYLFAVLFYAVPVGYGVKFPIVLLVLIFGGFFFTLRFGFVNVRMFRHSIDVLRGRYDHPEDDGEVTHFQALTSALSATVGLGNIGGVAAAIAMGGPGAIFWMWMSAFLGMSMKFTSCSLAQYYRRVKPDGSVLGGPMIYLEEGIKDRYPSLAPLGKILGFTIILLPTQDLI